MSQLDCNTDIRKGKHLTYEDHIRLETLYRLGLTSACIGEKLGGRSGHMVVFLPMWQRKNI